MLDESAFRDIVSHKLKKKNSALEVLPTNANPCSSPPKNIPQIADFTASEQPNIEIPGPGLLLQQTVPPIPTSEQVSKSDKSSVDTTNQEAESGSDSKVEPQSEVPPTEPQASENFDELGSDKLEQKPEKVEEGRSVEDIIPKQRWLANLPPNFRKTGLEVLEQLLAAEGLQVEPIGTLSIDNEPVFDFDIGTLLRTLVLPYHKGQLPPAVEAWLREQDMTTFPNQNLKIRPAWRPLHNLRPSTRATHREPSKDPIPNQHLEQRPAWKPLHNLRPSTRATRQEPSEDPKHSTRGRKRKA